MTERTAACDLELWNSRFTVEEQLILGVKTPSMLEQDEHIATRDRTMADVIFSHCGERPILFPEQAKARPVALCGHLPHSSHRGQLSEQLQPAAVAMAPQGSLLRP